MGGLQSKLKGRTERVSPQPTAIPKNVPQISSKTDISSKPITISGNLPTQVIISENTLATKPTATSRNLSSPQIIPKNASKPIAISKNDLPKISTSNATSEKTKMINLENTLQKVNSDYISLSESETRSVNEYFSKFIKKFVEVMRESDVLFKAIYQDVLYAGSFYDGLKITKPDEFDLDLIFNLPIDYSQFVFDQNDNYPGFVALRNDSVKHLTQHPGWTTRNYREMEKWFDKGYFLPEKLRFWLQSVVQNAFNSKKELTIDGAKITKKTSGPAVTLLIRGGKYEFDIDLVPVLQMNNSPILNQWPRSPVRSLPPNCKKQTWYCVPKPIKCQSTDRLRYWRLAFHEQEQFLIKGKDGLKPALRLLKKFRDTQNFCKLASYYLKTLCMWEIEKPENNKLWRQGLVPVFIHLLNVLKTALDCKSIPYYWESTNNLLKVVPSSTLENYCGKMKNILKSIDKDMNSLPKFILTKDEYAEFQLKQHGAHF